MDINRVGVIGSGVMGAQIAQVLATGGCTVRLHDVDQAQLGRAMQSIEHGRFGIRRGVERGKLPEVEADAALARLSTTMSLEEACGDADMVIEVVPEDIGLKVSVFRAVDRAAPPHAILTSNTAGLPIAALAYATDRPERVMGWHWFQPCSVMALAELIVHDGTSQEVCEAVVRAAERAGKRPQVVHDQPMKWGFVANRISMAARREALRIVQEGIATEAQVDAIMRDGYRWPVGPFELMGGSVEEAQKMILYL
jgi:3-hydroxybutyryl-CoA dehydrogenase